MEKTTKNKRYDIYGNSKFEHLLIALVLFGIILGCCTVIYRKSSVHVDCSLHDCTDVIIPTTKIQIIHYSKL